MNEDEQSNRGYTICQSLFQAALRAVDPRAATQRALRRDGEMLTVGGATLDLTCVRNIVVIGFGKAAVPMAQAVEKALGDRITRGIVVTKQGQRAPTAIIAVREAAHPTPDAAGIEATAAILDALHGLTRDDLVLCLVSGGGSALFEQPVDGVSLRDMQQTTKQLIRAGAPITALNAVRKHLSMVKGGQLARHAAPATLVALMVSDVVGDPLDVTASGPTVPDPTTFVDALAALDRYDVQATVPAAVRAYLEAGMRGEHPETPKSDDPCFATTHTHIIANAQMALDAAAQAAAAIGLPTLVLSSTFEGEAREVAGLWASIARQVRDHAQPIAPPCCLLAGGETTVTVTGNGQGGRNTEFTLAAALALDGTEGITIASLATDGGDGTTDAAGAVASGATIAYARAAGLDAADFVARNDAYTFFDRVGGLIRSGPTGTNVNDLMIALIE